MRIILNNFSFFRIFGLLMRDNPWGLDQLRAHCPCRLNGFFNHRKNQAFNTLVRPVLSSLVKEPSQFLIGDFLLLYKSTGYDNRFCLQLTRCELPGNGSFLKRVILQVMAPQIYQPLNSINQQGTSQCLASLMKVTNKRFASPSELPSEFDNFDPIAYHVTPCL